MKKLLLFFAAVMICSCAVKTYNVEAVREDNLDIDYYNGKEYLCSVIDGTEVDVTVKMDIRQNKMTVIFNAINESDEKITLKPDEIEYYFISPETSRKREVNAFTADGYVEYLQKRARNARFWGIVLSGVDAIEDSTSETTTYGWITDSSGNTSYHQNTVKETDPVASKLMFVTYCSKVNNKYLNDINNIRDISDMLLRKHTLRPGTVVTGIVVVDTKGMDIENEVLNIKAPLGDNVHQFSFNISKVKI